MNPTRHFAAALALLGHPATRHSLSRLPQKPLRLLVPFAPGAPPTSRPRPEPTLIKRSGSRSSRQSHGRGWQHRRSSCSAGASDGYTLLVGNILHESINPILFAKLMKVDALRYLARSPSSRDSKLHPWQPKLPAQTLRALLCEARPGHSTLSAAGCTHISICSRSRLLP